MMTMEVNILYQIEIQKDLYYACSTKVERNSITTSIFNNYISVTHPVDTSGVDLIDVSKNYQY